MRREVSFLDWVFLRFWSPEILIEGRIFQAEEMV
jgi:hypothetical protein